MFRMLKLHVMFKKNIYCNDISRFTIRHRCVLSCDNQKRLVQPHRQKKERIKKTMSFVDLAITLLVHFAFLCVHVIVSELRLNKIPRKMTSILKVCMYEVYCSTKYRIPSTI